MRRLEDFIATFLNSLLLIVPLTVLFMAMQKEAYPTLFVIIIKNVMVTFLGVAATALVNDFFKMRRTHYENIIFPKMYLDNKILPGLKGRIESLQDQEKIEIGKIECNTQAGEMRSLYNIVAECKGNTKYICIQEMHGFNAELVIGYFEGFDLAEFLIDISSIVLKYSYASKKILGSPLSFLLENSKQSCESEIYVEFSKVLKKYKSTKLEKRFDYMNQDAFMEYCKCIKNTNCEENIRNENFQAFNTIKEISNCCVTIDIG